MKSVEITKNKKRRKILLLSDEEKEIRKEVKDKLVESNIVAPNVYSFVKGKSAYFSIDFIMLKILIK